MAHTDAFAEIKYEASKKKIGEVYENYMTDPRRHKAMFWNAVLEFAKMKMYYLELEFSKIGTANTADDYAQEVAMAVWTGLSSFRGNGRNFYAWVHSICYKTAADFFYELKDKKDNTVGALIISKDEDGKEELIDNPEIHKSELRDSFIRIPSHVQGADLDICMMILAELSYKQIGERLGMKEQAVKDRLYRLRKKLKAEREAERETNKVRLTLREPRG